MSPMSPQRELSLRLLQVLLGASQRGAAVTMPLNATIVRVKRGRKMGVREGGFAYSEGRVMFAIPDEAYLNLHGPEEARDLWLLSRIQRQVADELTGEKPADKIIRPTLVGPDGRPVQ